MIREREHNGLPGLPVLGLAGSAFFTEARRLGLRTVTEGFADRAYLADARVRITDAIRA